MIYKIRANELDAEAYYVDADDQVEALQLAIEYWAQTNTGPYGKTRPLIVEWVSDTIIRK